MNLKLIFVLALISTSAMAANSSTGKTKKYYQSHSSSSIPAPQSVRPGNSLLGVRGAMGGAFDGSAILGANYEYILQPNIGIGAQVHHSGYSSKFGNAIYNGEWNYDIWVLNAYGAFHVDLFKVKELDTYATAGLGRTFVSSSVKSSSADMPTNEFAATASSGFFLTANINGRYFFTKNLSGVATLGLGLGTLGLGMDYLF